MSTQLHGAGERPLTARTLLYCCALSCAVAACARSKPLPARVEALPRPAAGRCERQLDLLSQSLLRSGVATRPDALAAFTEAAAVLREVRRLDPIEADACERRLEPLLRERALAARREDHLHQNTPGAEVLLALHRALFPAADRDGLVAFELGNCIAELTVCGCQGRPNDPSRWREVISAYADARRAPGAGKATGRWSGQRVPLPEALELGEALARQALESGRAGVSSWPGRQ